MQKWFLVTVIYFFADGVNTFLDAAFLTFIAQK